MLQWWKINYRVNDLWKRNNSRLIGSFSLRKSTVANKIAPESICFIMKMLSSKNSSCILQFLFFRDMHEL
jgi:hypothetical protein